MTYFLGAAVIIIWLLVFKTVKDIMGSDNSEEMPVIKPPTKEAFNDYAYKEDTTRLNLKYRDPFGLLKQPDTVKKITHLSRKSTVSVPKTFDWGFVSYSGFIRNPGSKRLIAIITINGKPAMMEEGETTNEVKLLKNQRDSVKIEYKGKTKFIGMH